MKASKNFTKKDINFGLELNKLEATVAEARLLQAVPAAERAKAVAEAEKVRTAAAKKQREEAREAMGYVPGESQEKPWSPKEFKAQKPRKVEGELDLSRLLNRWDASNR